MVSCNTIERDRETSLSNDAQNKLPDETHTFDSIIAKPQRIG
jgi:hypothetical protein